MSYKIDNIVIDFSMSGNQTETIPNLMGSTKVSELKRRIVDKHGGDNPRLTFGGKQLDDNKTLADYEIVSYSVVAVLLRLKGGTQQEDTRGRNMDVEFVKQLYSKMEISKDFKCEADVVGAPRYDSCESSEYYKAKMSCNHKWCGGCIFYYLEKGVNINGDFDIKCPQSDCQKPWHMNEVFASGNVQNVKQRIEFNKAMNRNGMIKNNLGNFCPNEKCRVFFSVGDDMKNRADSQCPKCKYIFCQFCRSKWNNSTLCKTKKCSGMAANVLKELLNCGTKEIWGVKNVPKKRLCSNPNCKAIFEHSSGCKRMKCPVCTHMQCHICTKRWIGKPCPNNGPCPCNYCSTLGEGAPDPCSYNIKCQVVSN